MKIALISADLKDYMGDFLPSLLLFIIHPTAGAINFRFCWKTCNSFKIVAILYILCNGLIFFPIAPLELLVTGCSNYLEPMTRESQSYYSTIFNKFYFPLTISEKFQ